MTFSDAPEVKKCDVCGFDMLEYGCSEFCLVATQEQIDKFKAGKLKKGEYEFYPCADCGVAIEDEWEPGAICYSCHKRRRVENRTSLLKQVLVECVMSDELRSQIEEELKT